MSEEKCIIRDGMVVKLQYRLSVEDSNLGNREPEQVIYLHGHDQIIPGFEKAVTGLSSGDAVSFDVLPDEGYGYREEEAKIDIPITDFPEGLPMEIGTELQMVNDDGDEIPGWLTEIKDETITVDFNHPLAEKKLHFDVEILAIRSGTEEEIQAHTVMDLTL